MSKKTNKEQERVQKFMARAGIASRRACEKLILDGRVKINGKKVTELGTKVGIDDVVLFDGHQIEPDQRQVYLLLYKPRNVISAVSDPRGREVVSEMVPKEYGRLFPVGRLDWDSEGAILMTNDGTLTQRMTHPRYKFSRTYIVKVRGLIPDNDNSLEKIREGVRLNDGYLTQPCTIVWDSDTGKHTRLIVTIREGKNRQIRRMFEAVGHTVLRLKRITLGPLILGDLLPGNYRRLSEEEIDELYESTGTKREIISVSRGRLPVAKRRPDQTRRKRAKNTN